MFSFEHADDVSARTESARTAMHNHRLQPGYVYLADGTTEIWTVLGRGMVVCLWDKRSRRGGMNHYLRPTSNDPLRGSPMYGDVALGLLISHMLVAGSRLEDLVARIYGCSSGDDANVALARQILDQYGIPLVEAEIDGTTGRRLTFDIQSGSIGIESRKAVFPDLGLRRAVSVA